MTNVKCPRNVLDKYWHATWTEVIHAAEAHEDGLEVVNTERAPEDFAVLRQGDGASGKDKTLLLSQGW